MKKYTKKLQEIETLDSVTCDICGHTYDGEDNTLHLQTLFGKKAEYFAERDMVSIDICEKCLFDFLKEKSLLEKCVKKYDDIGIPFDQWLESMHQDEL